jgi:hypothetical protein
MNKAQAQHKIALALDLINEVGSEVGRSDAYFQLVEMKTSGDQALSILHKEAVEEQAAFLVNYRSAHA